MPSSAQGGEAEGLSEQRGDITTVARRLEESRKVLTDLERQAQALNTSRRHLQRVLTWVHANGGIINGGVACVCAKWCAFVHFCAFLRFFVRFCAFFPTKRACKKAQICAEFWKNVQKALLCNTPFSYTPFCVSPTHSFG